MTSRYVLSRAVAGAVVAGAMTLGSLVTGVASADTGIQTGVGELQEYTLSQTVEPADGDVDGRDFLIWQKSTGVVEAQPTEEVAFYYNKITFNYTKIADGVR